MWYSYWSTCLRNSVLVSPLTKRISVLDQLQQQLVPLYLFLFLVCTAVVFILTFTYSLHLLEWRKDLIWSIVIDWQYFTITIVVEPGASIVLNNSSTGNPYFCSDKKGKSPPPQKKTSKDRPLFVTLTCKVVFLAENENSGLWLDVLH